MRLATGSAVLWIIPAVYLVFVAAEFAALTYLALKATADGRSALSVGLLATSLWTGILLASARSHVAVARWGYGVVFVSATLLSTLAIATLPWHEQFPGWLVACFVLGFGGGFVWVAGEPGSQKLLRRHAEGCTLACSKRPSVSG